MQSADPIAKRRPGSMPRKKAPHAYLANLNDRQRNAVEHGVDAVGVHVGSPLLVIAGAGSGKTNTLAHRVAHLVLNDADPLRILLMTFDAAPGRLAVTSRL